MSTGMWLCACTCLHCRGRARLVGRHRHGHMLQQHSSLSFCLSPPSMFGGRGVPGRAYDAGLGIVQATTGAARVAPPARTPGLRKARATLQGCHSSRGFGPDAHETGGTREWRARSLTVALLATVISCGGHHRQLDHSGIFRGGRRDLRLVAADLLNLLLHGKRCRGVCVAVACTGASVRGHLRRDDGRPHALQAALPHAVGSLRRHAAGAVGVAGGVEVAVGGGGRLQIRRQVLHGRSGGCSG